MPKTKETEPNLFEETRCLKFSEALRYKRITQSVLENKTFY